MPSAVRKQSFGSVSVFSLDKKVVEEALQAWVLQLRRRPEILAVVLFGSFAKGRALPGSDLDVLLVLRDHSHPFRERLVEYMPDDFPLPVDVFPYTVKEIQTGQPLALEALRTGQILWFREELNSLCNKS